MSATLTLRPATPADEPFLLALRRDTMLPHLIEAGIGTEDEAMLARVRANYQAARIALLDDQPAGLLKALRTEHDWYLIQVQVSPAFQGQGLGARLVALILDEADRDNVPVRLTVLHRNPARRLYERMGFVIAETGEHEYTMRYTPGSPRPSA